MKSKFRIVICVCLLILTNHGYCTEFKEGNKDANRGVSIAQKWDINDKPLGVSYDQAMKNLHGCFKDGTTRISKYT